MLTHSDIIARAGNPEKLALAVGVSVHTVRSWKQRGSIPADQWLPLIDREFATFDELAAQARAA